MFSEKISLEKYEHFNEVRRIHTGLIKCESRLIFFSSISESVLYENETTPNKFYILQFLLYNLNGKILKASIAPLPQRRDLEPTYESSTDQ